MIAVVGAGGGTGLEVVKELLARGKEVRAVVRSPEKYAGKFGTAQVMKGDATDEASLHTAFAGCAGVVFAASASKYKGAGGPYQVDYLGCLNTCNAAKAVDAKLVVVSSRLVNPINRWNLIRIILNNVKYSLMDYKFMAEEAVRNSGVKYTIVRPGGLTGGEGQRAAASPPGTEHIVAGAAEANMGRTYSIHRTDVASVVCEALTSEDANHKTIELVARPHGQDDPSFEDRLKSIFKEIPVEPQGRL